MLNYVFKGLNILDIINWNYLIVWGVVVPKLCDLSTD